MHLVYAHTAEGNFGDDLNLVFWDELLPGWRNWDASTELVGIGTIFEDRRLAAGRRHLVIGSGIGYAPPPADLSNPRFDIRAVRGPRSAAALGLPADKGIVDPAVLVARWPRFRGIAPTGQTLIVPHFGSVPQYPWRRLSAEHGLEFVSPSDSPEAVIARIAGAKRVLAESMHAAIVADAFRVPWTPIRINASYNAFKWLDWAESLGVRFETVHFFGLARRAQAWIRTLGLDYRRPYAAPTHGVAERFGREPKRSSLNPILELWLARHLKAAIRAPSYLSDDSRLTDAMDRLEQVLADVRRDYATQVAGGS